jgi:hypothetical protein
MTCPLFEAETRDIPDSHCEQFEGGQMCGLVPGDEQECTIVSVDPCSGRAGYVCFDGYEEHSGRAPTPRKPQAAEKLLMPVGCTDEPLGKPESVCNEARLKRVEQEARELGKGERFECERKRLEELEQTCGATFSENQRARLMKLLADNAFRRGDFPRCRELLRDARPSDALSLVEWAESTGRWRVWNSGAPEVIQSCLKWAWPSGPPEKSCSSGEMAPSPPRCSSPPRADFPALRRFAARPPPCPSSPMPMGLRSPSRHVRRTAVPRDHGGAKFSWNGKQLSPVK